MIKERIKNNKAGEPTSYREVHYEYDSMHRPTAVKTNDGTRDIYTQYAYDIMGNVTKVVTGTVWGRNSLGTCHFLCKKY